jgi:stress response protein YsnF
VGVQVAQPREPWHEGDVLVVPVYEEVIERRLVLKEEIRLHRQRFSTSHTEQVPLRRQRAVVERRQADGSWAEVDNG